MGQVQRLVGFASKPLHPVYVVMVQQDIAWNSIWLLLCQVALLVYAGLLVVVTHSMCAGFSTVEGFA
jgi:hypothetical protein